MNFANPYFLLLLLSVPLYIGLFFVWKRQQGFGVSVFSDLVLARNKTWTRVIPMVRHGIILTVLVLGSITLAHPQQTYETQHISKEGIDIVIALDVSDSMRAEDLSPNRIESAKKSLEQFIDARTSDRIGIVIFSGVPFTQSPLTFDYDILKYFMQNISTKSINQGAYGAGGTAIGDALLASVHRLVSEGDEKKEEDTEREKIVVLISDGDANVGIDPIIAAKKAKQEGITVYTIGVGKEGGAPIPVRDAWGNTQYGRNRDGTIFMATFNPETLQRVAAITDGKFFRVDDDAGFSTVLADIDALEKRTIEIDSQTRYSDAFAGWLYVFGVMVFVFAGLEMWYRLRQ